MKVIWKVVCKAEKRSPMCHAELREYPTEQAAKDAAEEKGWKRVNGSSYFCPMCYSASKRGR